MLAACQGGTYMTVLYSCPTCHLSRELAVKQRRESQCLNDWMDDVIVRATQDHDEVNPGCDSGVFHLRMPQTHLDRPVGTMSLQ